MERYRDFAPERVKTIGEYRLYLTQCTVLRSDSWYYAVPWTWVRLVEMTGAPVYTAVLRDDDVTLEVLTQIESHRAFLVALRNAEAQGAEEH